MTIWIINHYAIPPSLGGLNRHYYFSKYLQEMRHTVKIFTASAVHNTSVNMIEGPELYAEKIVDGIEYTYVKTSSYQGNSLSRIRNMLEFPLRIGKVCKEFPKPDVVYASSPSPFAAVAALLLAKKIKRPCIVEIRDLWPESIVAYQKKSKWNPVIMALYMLEKWIYKRADRLVFTMEGGKDYIIERGWEKSITLLKVHHINNGVDLEVFDRNAEEDRLMDDDLEQPETFKVVYTGSVRRVNDLLPVVKAFEILKEAGENRIQLIVYGDGDELPQLMQYQQEHGLSNISFKGRVDRKYIPHILLKCNVLLMHGGVTPICRFGLSLNKLFDYLAAGKPILTDLLSKYDLLEQYHCGVLIPTQDPEAIAESIQKMSLLSEQEYKRMSTNARRAAVDYDFQVLTRKLAKILEEVAQ